VEPILGSIAPDPPNHILRLIVQRLERSVEPFFRFELFDQVADGARPGYSI
jgi:hypothetical protein